MKPNLSHDWNLNLLVKGHLLALLLILSWNFSPTKELWRIADHTSFAFLNNSLENKPSLQILFAMLNHRSLDLITALCMALPILHFLSRMTPLQSTKELSFFLAFCLFTLTCILCTKQIGKFFGDFHRLSPSLTMPSVVFLAEVIPSLSIKASSHNSFPGDHTFVLLMWACYLSRLKSRSYLLYGISLSVLASLPRLISGAHWLTDDLVGAGTLASIIASWALASPVCSVIASLLEPYTSRFFFLKKEATKIT